MMNEEGAFIRLLELIQSPRRGDGVGGAGLHRLLMELLYEMSRIQRIKFEDLGKLKHDPRLKMIPLREHSLGGRRERLGGERLYTVANLLNALFPTYCGRDSTCG